VGVAAASSETTFVDLGVYTRNRCFRLYKSSKLAGQAELRPARLSAAEQATLPGHFLDTSWTLEGSLPQSRPFCRTLLLLSLLWTLESQQYLFLGGLDSIATTNFRILSE